MFFGRENELRDLKRFLKKKTASLIVIRGRRRIGKSTLVERFAEGIPFYVFSGLPPTEKTTAQSQRDEFALQLGTYIGVPGIKAYDWNTLFLLLAKHVKNDRAIILLDEISWMGSKDSNFLGKLKNAWDLHFKKNDKLILILCGSASSWIEKNIISSTGFLGRISYTLTLEELSIKDCMHFWGKSTKRIDPYEKCKILAVTGGVPRYLEEINPKVNAEENIKLLCFSKGGLLVDEFDNIFSDLFLSKSSFYKGIIKSLSMGPSEYTEICKKIGIGQSGRISMYLNELELAGFIKREYTWDLKSGNDAKLSQYRLSDNYLHFFLRYIDKNINRINKGIYVFRSLTSLPGWETSMGLQFENLILNNRALIHQVLNIDLNDIVNSGPYFQHKTRQQKGCQIDYLIHTKFGCMYLCEIKFSKNPIGLSIVQEIEEKIERFKTPKGHSIRPVLIHINGVTKDLIDSDYFANIIDFSQFLRRPQT